MVLGATGQVGGLICEHLKNNDAISLTVTSRKREQLASLSQTYGKAVYLDLDDPRTFTDAMQGIDRLFLVTGYTVDMLVQSKAIVDAAGEDPPYFFFFFFLGGGGGGGGPLFFFSVFAPKLSIQNVYGNVFNGQKWPGYILCRGQKKSAEYIEKEECC